MNFKINPTICVVGLGYVGLPLAVAFEKYYQVIGYDINDKRVHELKHNIDSTCEIDTKELESISRLRFTSELAEIEMADVYIVTVPTPVDNNNLPDLSPLISASKSISEVLSVGNVVIFESTVFPGATEEVCVPNLSSSGLVFNSDYFVGYSPERVNPGDKTRKIENIIKVTSGSTTETAEFVDELYKTVIKAGTHKASSIKIAEASKIIENIQRDVNIALINELHQIFNILEIPTLEVVDAASTKWNFMKLNPGLVGGHCIGVDPYYLLHRSVSKGYIPDLMRSAREINNSMPEYLAHNFLEFLIKNEINPIRMRVLLLGITFKEDCPDIRNTKVIDLYYSLVKLGFDVVVYDPVANKEEVLEQYGVELVRNFDQEFDIAFLAVGHKAILDSISEILNKSKNKKVYDFKGLLK